MTDAARAIIEQVQRLPQGEQRELLAELQRVIGAEKPESNGRSILELAGLGREIWHGIDAQEYVRRERASWNG